MSEEEQPEAPKLSPEEVAARAREMLAKYQGRKSEVKPDTPEVAAMRQSLMDALKKKQERYDQSAFSDIQAGVTAQNNALSVAMANLTIAELTGAGELQPLHHELAAATHRLWEAALGPMEEKGITLIPQQHAVMQDLMNESREKAEGIIGERIEQAEERAHERADRIHAERVRLAATMLKDLDPDRPVDGPPVTLPPPPEPTAQEAYDLKLARIKNDAVTHQLATHLDFMQR